MRKPKKPPDIVYGVDDVPPWPATLLSACQHVGSLAPSLAVPVIIFHQARLPLESITGIVGLSFLGLAVAAVLQALPRGPVGSGYLAPSAFAALYIAPSSAAIAAGGLKLMFGMTFFAGVVQSCLSPVVRHIRSYLPPEIAGTVTFLLGLGQGTIGLRNLLGFGFEGPVPTAHWIVGPFTLCTIVILNVWTSGLIRMSCVLIGMVAGYVAAVATGLMPIGIFVANPAPILALPHFTGAGLSFDATLLLPFLIAALVATVKSIAVTTTCQRTNDAAYIRPDLASINRGVLADGLVTAMAGLMGTAAFNANAASPGLAAATGVTSRRVAYAIAGVMTVLAFSPAAASVFSSIPDAVAGSLLTFSSCFVITSGIEIMASRLLDSRRMLVIAASILAAEGAHTVGEALTLPPALQQLVATPLLLGTLVALMLNAVFRPGTRRGSVLELDAASLDPEAIHNYMDARGAAWGARPDVIQRAGFALAELIESLVRSCEATGRIRVVSRFNEFRVDVQVTYHGVLMPFPATRPSMDDIAESEDGLLRLSGFLVRRQTDGVRATKRNGDCVIDLHFDH